MTLRRDLVLVALPPRDRTTTPAGIVVLPAPALIVDRLGVVLLVGAAVQDVAPLDRVLFGSDVGEELRLFDRPCVLLRVQDVDAVLEEPMPDEIVLEAPTDAPSGMPTGTVAPPQDLGQPLVDPGLPPDEELPPPPPPEEPPARGGILGELVEERAARRSAEQQAASAADLLRQVMADPQGVELLQRVAAGETGGAQQQQQEALQQELEATALDLGLYDTQGQPDLAAAGRIMARESRRVEAQVQRAVQALAQQEIAPLKAQRTEQTIHHVKAVATHYGIDPDMVERGLRTLPPDQISNPEVQQTVLMTALGLQTFGAGGVAPQGTALAPGRDRTATGQFTAATTRGNLRPPIYQEAAGGRPRSAPMLDEPFRARLRESGLKDADINASLDRFVPGAPNRLE